MLRNDPNMTIPRSARAPGRRSPQRGKAGNCGARYPAHHSPPYDPQRHPPTSILTLPKDPSSLAPCMAFTLVKKLAIEALLPSSSSTSETRRLSSSTSVSAPTSPNDKSHNNLLAQSAGLTLTGRQQTPLFHGQHSLLVSTPSVDYYLLPNARMVAHTKKPASLAIVDAIQTTATSSSPSQAFNSQNAKPLVLSASGESLELVVFLSTGSIALLSFKIASSTTLAEQRTNNESPSPKPRQFGVAQSTTELQGSGVNSSDDSPLKKHAAKSSKSKSVEDPKKSTVDERNDAVEGETPSRGSKEHDERKALKWSKKFKEARKYGDSKKDKDAKKDKDGKKDRKTPSPSAPIEIQSISALVESHSPTASPNSSSSRRGTPSSPPIRHKGASKSDSEDFTYSEDMSESSLRSTSTGRKITRKRSLTPPTATSSVTGVDESGWISNDEGISGSPSQSSIPRNKRDRAGSRSIGRQASVAELPSTLKRSQDSPSPLHQPTKLQWIQVLSIDTVQQSVFPSATLHPDVCAEMGGIRKLLPGLNGALLIETEDGKLFHLNADSSLPQPLKFPDDVNLRLYHLQALPNGDVIFLKKSAGQVVVCTLEPAPFSPATDKSDSPQRKPKKSSKFGILDHFRTYWFSSSSVAAIQDSEAEHAPPPLLKPIIRSQSPEGATFLKFDVQNGLLLAFTAVSLLTWEIGNSPSRGNQCRIPLLLPIFATAVTRDRILTGDIDGNITVFERSTGRKQYLLNCAESEEPLSSSLPSPTSPLNSDPGNTPRIRLSSGNRKPSLVDRMANRVIQLFVFWDYYVVARFDHGECSVWSLAANQIEPLQRIVKRPTTSTAAKAGFLAVPNADGLLCMYHVRGTTRSKLRILRCRPPLTSYSTTSTVSGESLSTPRAATLISGEIPDQTYRAASDYVDEITKLSLRIFSQYPWLGQLNEAICVVDILQSSKSLVYVNAAFEKLTLFASEEVLGTNLKFLQGKYTTEEMQTKYRNALDAITTDPGEFELLCYRKDGQSFFSQWTFLPIKQRKHNKTSHMVLILRDISHQKLLPQRSSEWSDAEVAVWLEESKFSTYGLTFIHKQVTGMTLLQADENFLVSIGVVRDDVDRLLQLISELRPLVASSISNPSSISTTMPTSSSLTVHGLQPQHQSAMQKSLSSSSMSMSMSLSMELDADATVEDLTSASTHLRANNTSTLIKLDYKGTVAMFLQKHHPEDNPWQQLQLNIEERIRQEGPLQCLFEDPVAGPIVVTESNWTNILTNHSHQIIRLRLTPMSSPGSTASSMPLPRLNSSMTELSVLSTHTEEEEDTDSLASSLTTDSLMLNDSTASPKLRLPKIRPALGRSVSSAHLSDSGSANTSPRMSSLRLEEMFQLPSDSISRSSSKDLLCTTRAGSTPSLSLTSISSLSALEHGGRGLLGAAFRRCVERIRTYSRQGAKTMDRVFQSALDRYQWLSTATGAVAIVENTALHPFIFANSEMERLTLFPRSQILGHNYKFLFGKCTEPAAQAALEFPQSSFASNWNGATNGAPVVDLEVVLFSAAGLPFVCSVLAYPIYASKDNNIPSHLLCMHSDMTTIKLQEVPSMDWGPVEVCAWLLHSEFATSAKSCFEAGLSGSDLLAAADNPRAIDLLARNIGLTHAAQRVDFAELVRRLRSNSGMRSPAHALYSSSNLSSSSEHSVTPTSLSGIPSGSTDPSMSPPVTPRFLIPSSSIGSPRSVSSPVPTTPLAPTPRAVTALKGALEHHYRNDEKTVAKFYLGRVTAILPLHNSIRFDLDRIIQCAAAVLGTGSDIELRFHSRTLSASKRNIPCLDSESWRKLYQDMKGKIIRLDVVEFNSLGLPIDVDQPLLFQDNDIQDLS